MSGFDRSLGMVSAMFKLRLSRLMLKWNLKFKFFIMVKFGLKVH